MLKLTFLICGVLIFLPCFAQQSEYPTIACMEALESQPRLAPIREKVALGAASKATFQMYALEQVASAEEKDVIVAWAEGRRNCYELGRSYLRQIDPQQATLTQEAFNAGQRMLADLYNGKLTFGEFNKKRAESVAEYGRREDAIIEKNNPKRTRADLDRDHAACVYDVQRAAASAQQRPFYAPGSGQFQGGIEALGSTLATRQQTAGMYDNCMQAKGWRR